MAALPQRGTMSPEQPDEILTCTNGVHMVGFSALVNDDQKQSFKAHIVSTHSLFSISASNHFMPTLLPVMAH